MLKTPFYDIHLSLGAKIAPFGGWLMPIQYEGILAEHAHTRASVSVFDICHMGEFLLEADPAASGFDRIVTQNIVSMPLASCRYGFMLNQQAGVIDDLVVYRIDKTKWMLVVNAATTAKDFAHLKGQLLQKSKLEDISGQTAKLDVQGPFSLEVLREIFGSHLAELGYYRFADFVFENQACKVSRTGYTGELGFEIYTSNSQAIKLWERLLKDKRVKPAGLGSRDTLRLEMGYPLYGQDLDEEHSPYAAGLMKFVDLSKDFIGKAALLREKEEGVCGQLTCFKADSRRSPRHGFSIYDQDRRIGSVTSGSFSPSLSTGIAMGYISGNYPTGSRLLVKDAQAEIPVTVVNRPFLAKKGTDTFKKGTDTFNGSKAGKSACP